MPKNRNKGGSGGYCSTQTFVTGRLKKCNGRYPLKGVSLTPNELKEYFSGKEIECLECGNFFKVISNHLVYAHDLTKNDYCLKYGIPINTPLIAEYSSQKRSASAKLDIKNNPERGERLNSSASIAAAIKVHKDRSYECTCPDCNKITFHSLVRFKSDKGIVRCKACQKKNRRKRQNNLYNKGEEVSYPCGYCEKPFLSSNRRTKWKIANSRVVYCSITCSNRRINDQRHKQYRVKYIKAIKKAIDSQGSLFMACKIEGINPSAIQNYVKRHPEDRELVVLYKAIRATPKGIIKSQFSTKDCNIN